MVTPEQAHLALLASDPGSSSHDPATCPFAPLCEGQTTERAEAAVPDEATNTDASTELTPEFAEHLAREVERAAAEAGALSADKINDLQARLDAAEAAALVEKARADEAVKALTDFQANLEAEKAHAETRDARRAEMLEVAGTGLAEFVTDERAERWAAMDETAFEAAKADLADLAARAPHAYLLNADTEAACCGRCGNEETASIHVAATAAPKIPAAGEAETAAFKGGKTPTAVRQGSKTAAYLSARQASRVA